MNKIIKRRIGGIAKMSDIQTGDLKEALYWE